MMFAASSYPAAAKRIKPLMTGSSNDSSSTDPLTAQLNNMSIEDRDDALHDLHGISNTGAIEETPEMLKEKVHCMSNDLLSSIATLRAEESLAYRKALMMSPEYVEGLKVNFVRTTGYNSKEAARKMMKFFQHKMEFFGQDKLVTEITQEDLSEKARDALQKGLFVVFPQRDRAGRAVGIVNGEATLHFEFDAVSQALHYIIMSLLQDKETQLRGVVIIWYGIGQSRYGNRTGEYTRIWGSMPTRLAGCHTCTDNPNVMGSLLLGPILTKFLEATALCRMRFHQGSYVECIYNVMTFGIPRDSFPIAEDGSWDLTHHRKMLEILKQRQQNEKEQEGDKRNDNSTTSQNVVTSGGEHQCNEQHQLQVNVVEVLEENNNDSKKDTDENGIILIPGPLDIILGRGRQGASRPGYLKMYNLIAENMELYETTKNKFEKTIIAEIIVKKMRESGTRMLSEAPGGVGGYVECDHKVARTKIAHAFRNQRENKRKKEKAEAAAAAASAVTMNEAMLTTSANPNEAPPSLSEAKKRNWSHSFSS